MSNPAWGMKRICPNCGTRYYDFQKEPPACPVCATIYDPEALLKSRRSKAPVEEAPKRKKAAIAAVVADELTGDELQPDGGETSPDLEDDEVDAEAAEGADTGDDTLLEDDADDLDDEIEEVDVDDEEES